MLGALAIIFHQALIQIVKLSLSVNHYSHIVVVPLLSAVLLYRDRHNIFSTTAPAIGSGSLLALLAIPVFMLAPTASEGKEAYLFARGLELLILVIAAFMFCYGMKAFRSAAFPLLFLFLAVPLPMAVVEHIIVFLQKGSADVCDFLFAMTRVPYLRRGDVFHLSNLTIEIAQECSGIRSAIALLVTTLLAVHLFMNSWWKKALVVAAVVPLVLLKNGLRIVTLTLLSVYVDRGFLSGWLHTSGGIVFYLLALAIIAVLLRVLRPNPRTSERAHTAHVPS